MMRRSTIAAVFIGLSLLVIPERATAQPAATAPASDTTTVTLNFSDLVSVEPVEGDSPAVIVEVFVPEMRTRTVSVVKTRAETRTRLVKVDGKQVEQKYVVQVPYSEMVEQAYTVLQRKKETVPSDKVQGWDLAGNPLEPLELIDRLSDGPVVFMLKQPWPANGQLDRRQRSVLRNDVLLLHLKKPSQNRAEP